MSEFHCICLCYKRVSNVQNFHQLLNFYVPGRRCKWTLNFCWKNFGINTKTLRRGSESMGDRVKLTRVHTVKKIRIFTIKDKCGKLRNILEIIHSRFLGFSVWQLNCILIIAFAFPKIMLYSIHLYIQVNKYVWRHSIYITCRYIFISI